MKRLLITSTILASLAMTSSAFAADANPELLVHPSTFVPGAIAAIIMFGLLFFLLKSTAWGPILQGLQDRETKIRNEIESAEDARTKATAALEEYQKELASARAEANQMIQQAKADAQSVADDLRSKNETELSGMKERAKAEIEAAKRAALNEIFAETALLSTQIASKILERELNPNDQQDLVKKALAQLSSVGGTSN